MSLRLPLRLGALVLVLSGACRDGPTGPNIGTLEVLVSGLPAGAAAAITVASADGFSQVVTATTTFSALVPGRYTLTAANVEAEQDVFAVPAAVEVRVRRGRTVEGLVQYALASGTLSFVVDGLPTGAVAEATLHGPSGAERVIALPSVVRGLIAGAWTVTVPRASAEGHGWDALPLGTLVVSATATPSLVPVTFALATGSLNIVFSGLPAGVEPGAVIFGPAGLVDTVTANGIITGLTPGFHSISPLAAFDADVQYLAAWTSSAVTATYEAPEVTVAYTPRSGRIAFASTGLPGSVAPAARITGPDFDQIVNGADTLRAVRIGTYQVQGVMVADAASAYSSATAVSVIVTGANTSDVTLDYTPNATVNVAVDAAYLVQSVQNYAGSVPLLAGRDALLRSFGVASAANGFALPIRVRLLSGPATVFEATIAAPTNSVPTSADQSTLARSWNVAIPGALIQPGVALEVTIDPDATLPEADRSDNTVAVSPLDVRAVPPFRARFVPIRVSSGQLGNLTTANAEAFLANTRAMMPVDSIDWDVRSEFITSQPFLLASDGNVWSTILSELYVLRLAENTGRYYMGILPVGYTSGIAGMAYLQSPSSVTWDRLPSGTRVLAHELGHNFGRYHSPCGSPGGPDANYPYPGADIGVYGYDATTGELKPPTLKDLMSYCADNWISDYTFAGALQVREAFEAANASVYAASAPMRTLLVSGRIVSGRTELDPVFEITAAATLPTGGAHRLELRDDQGRALFEASFAGHRIPDLGDGTDEHFAFTIPVSALGGRELASLSVTARGRRAEVSSPPAAALQADGRAIAARLADGSVRVSWSDPATRGLIIRDAATGQILTITRGNSALLPRRDGELEILASDGLRTRTGRVRPAPY